MVEIESVLVECTRVQAFPIKIPKVAALAVLVALPLLVGWRPLVSETTKKIKGRKVQYSLLIVVLH